MKGIALEYYGLAIHQNTLKKSNPTDREVDVTICTTKKDIIAILNHSVKGEGPAKQHRFCPIGETSWCKWQQDLICPVQLECVDQE